MDLRTNNSGSTYAVLQKAEDNTQAKAPEPVKYTFGDNTVYIGSEASKVFTRDFLATLVKSWQDKLRQPPTTMFINIDNENGARMNATLEEISKKAISSKEFNGFKKSIGASAMMPDYSDSLYDKNGDFLACAINIDAKRSAEVWLQMMLKVPAEDIKSPPMGGAALAKGGLTHEMGHCGAGSYKNVEMSLIFERGGLTREVIADRFLGDILDENSGLYPGLTRDHVRQMRSIGAVHYGMHGSDNVDQSHLTAPKLGKDYKDIQDVDMDSGFLGFSARLEGSKSVSRLLNSVASGMPREIWPPVSDDEIVGGLFRREESLYKSKTYKELSSKRSRLGWLLLATEEEKSPLKNYDIVTEALRRPDASLEKIPKEQMSESIRQALEETRDSLAQKKQRQSLHEDLPFFAQTMQKLYNEKRFETDEAVNHLAKEYLAGVKTFLPHWLPDEEAQLGLRPPAPSNKPN